MASFSQDSIAETTQALTPTELLSSEQSTYRPRRHFQHLGPYRSKANALATFGLAMGPECLFAPKFGIQGRYGYSYDMRKSRRDLSLFGVHGGAEFSFFGLFAIWGSAGVNAGVSVGPFTLDGSLTFWGIAGENNHFGSTTFNPKVGLQVLDYVWIKAGYSHFLRGDILFPNCMKYGDRAINIEVLAVIPLD